MTDDEYIVSGNIIIFSKGVIKTFDFPVKTTIKFGSIVFVLLDILGTKYNENVFAINDTGKTIWQIEKSETLNKIGGECPYTDIEIKNDQLSLYNWCGFRFTVDPSNGKIIEEVFTK